MKDYPLRAQNDHTDLSNINPWPSFAEYVIHILRSLELWFSVFFHLYQTTCVYGLIMSVNVQAEITTFDPRIKKMTYTVQRSSNASPCISKGIA